METKIIDLCVQSWTYRTKANADKLLALARAAGINVLSLELHQGGANYNSAYFPKSSDIEAGFSPVAYLIEQGHKASIQIFGWVCPGVEILNSAWNMKGRSWRDDRTASGTMTCPNSWLNFSIAAARQSVANIAADILNKCPGLDGEHLDYIRYHPSGTFSPKHAIGLSDADITQTVLLVRQAVAGRAKLYAYVMSGWWADAFHQDWPLWLRNGLIDYAQPMSYLNTTPELQKDMAGWPQELKGAITPTICLRLYGGGISGAKPLAEIASQISAVLAAGFPGFALFDNRDLDTAGVVDTIARFTPPPPPPPIDPSAELAAVYAALNAHSAALYALDTAPITIALNALKAKLNL